jgi:hypothetical protein
MEYEKKDATVIDIAKVGAAVAALSVLTVFLASLGSVMYTRGLFSELGFPASAVGAKAAADMFTVIAYQRCFVLVAVAIIGFIPTQWSRLSEKTNRFIFLTVLLIAVMIMGVSIGTGSQSRAVRIPMGILATIFPFFAGYVFRSAGQEVARYSKVLVIFLGMLAAFSLNLREIGSGHAMKVVSTELNNRETDQGNRFTRTPKDFSVVTLVSKEEVSFLTGGRKVDGGYVYAPTSKAFLRFIAEDESKYFLIEKTSNSSTPCTLRKESVVAMMFEPGSGVSRPTP